MENVVPADGERVLVARAGTDPAAFAELYEVYLDRVFRYVRTYTECDDDAADLTQHVFLRVLEALPRYQDRGVPFATWLFRIARNAAIDTYRRQRRVLPWDHVPDIVYPLGTPETVSVQREQLNQLRLRVAQLSPDKQELLALRFAAGLSSREIGPLVGKSEAAVQKALVRIMRTLKEQMRDDEI